VIVAVDAGRVTVAALMALVLAVVGLGMLRSLRRVPKSAPAPSIEPPPAGVRVTFWCGTCGTEVLVLRMGSDAAPRHCGEAMVRREEVAHGSDG